MKGTAMELTILVIDDSEFTRNYHCQILEEAGYAVRTAVDGSDGLEKLCSGPCDAVLTDINMSRMDGIEFIRRVREEAHYEDLPIVVVSTQADAAHRQRGLDAGADLYIPKPCDPELMVENLRMVLDGR